MLRILISIFVLACLCLSSATAGIPRPIDLDAEPGAWQGTIIAVVQPTAKAPVRTGQFTTVHEIQVERVLYGPGKGYPGGYLERYTIPVTSYYEDSEISHPRITLAAGEHYILIMSVGPGVLIYGDTWMNLGPLHNVMPVTSKYDTVIDKMQMIIDLASCPDTSIKDRRLQELESKELGDALVAQYVLQAQANLAKTTSTHAVNLCRTILYNGGALCKSDPATLVLADRLLLSLSDNTARWSTSIERKTLFSDLLAKMKPDDPHYQYVKDTAKRLAIPPGSVIDTGQ